MWPDLIAKAKEGGLDVIQTYVFWNGHEPQPGEVIFVITYWDNCVSVFHILFAKVCFFFYCSIILRGDMIW